MVSAPRRRARELAFFRASRTSPSSDRHVSMTYVPSRVTIAIARVACSLSSARYRLIYLTRSSCHPVSHRQLHSCIMHCRRRGSVSRFERASARRPLYRMSREKSAGLWKCIIPGDFGPRDNKSADLLYKAIITSRARGASLQRARAEKASLSVARVSAFLLGHRVYTCMRAARVYARIAAVKASPRPRARPHALRLIPRGSHPKSG